MLSVNQPKNYQTFPITPWYTEKNSYLKLYKPKEKELKCGLRYSLEMIIKTPGSEFVPNTIYFQLQSRSNFTFIGSYDIQNEKLSVQNGQNKIFFDVKLTHKVLNLDKENSNQSKLKSYF